MIISRPPDRMYKVDRWHYGHNFKLKYICFIAIKITFDFLPVPTPPIVIGSS